jgi:hypothetical protein
MIQVHRLYAFHVGETVVNTLMNNLRTYFVIHPVARSFKGEFKVLLGCTVHVRVSNKVVLYVVYGKCFCQRQRMYRYMQKNKFELTMLHSAVEPV